MIWGQSCPYHEQGHLVLHGGILFNRVLSSFCMPGPMVGGENAVAKYITSWPS